MFERKADELQPRWYKKIAPDRSYRSIFKWGAIDQFKHPNKNLYRFMKRALGMSDEDFAAGVELGEEVVEADLPGALSDGHIERLREIVGPENVTTDGYSRLEVAYGKTMIDLMRLRKKIVENLPDAVVCPRTAEDVKALVGYCSEHGIAITPFGGGSSVTRGVECLKGGISLDMRRHMKRVIELNPINQTVTVEPGIFGPALERALNDAPERFGTVHRYTCGHFPQSFEYSTVGGWVVTRGAGQSSTYYGKIEQMVVSQRYVTPAGEIATRELPPCAMGPDIDQIMIGSEGAFGVLVDVTLQIFRYLPGERVYFSFIFPSWPEAVEAVREVMQAEIGRPSVFRLSDPEETEVGLKLYGIEGTVIDLMMNARGYRTGQRCLLLGSADGDGSYTRTVKRGVERIVKRFGAMSTTGFVTRRWEKGRYRDPYLRDDLHDYGVVMDTLECAVAWDRVMPVWRGVKDYCHRRPNTVCMVHMSHFYQQGANLYFIFIARMQEIEEYLEFQSGILDQIREHGAAMSHHHGIGKMIAPWLEGAIGTEQIELLRALKRHLDPKGIMNPGGTLGLDLPEDARRD